MNTITRGMRNAFRNSIRTFSIVLILGLSIGLALAMLVARASVQDKIADVKSSIGNTITIMPAGSQGFQGGGEPLTTSQMDKVRSTPNVTKVVETLSDRLTTDNTNLTSAIDAGSLGRRAGGNSGVGFQRFGGGQFGGGDGQIMRTFTPPIIVTGTNDTSSSVFGGNSLTFTSGQNIDTSADKNEAVVGKALADKNSLKTGSTFTAYGQTITVTGVYDTGNTFSNGGLVMSLPTVQRLSGQASDVTNAVATVNSVDNLDSTTTAIKSTLGDAADVTSSQDAAKQAVQPLESVKNISTFSLVGAVVAGAVIILLTMVMIVRERRREIGVFKAIGASNIKVVSQFVVEAVTLTVLALGAGLIIGALAASPITDALVSNSNTASQTAQFANREGPGAPRPRLGRQFRALGSNTATNVRNVKASVGTNILIYGVVTAFVIAIIGSALPALLISKVRPAEVMRAE